MNETEREEALRDLASFTNEEIEITIAAMEAAKMMRSVIEHMAPDRVEDFAELCVEFALEAEVGLDDEIDLARTVLATRTN